MSCSNVAMSLLVSMYFKFKQTGYKCVDVYQCVFSVITSFGNQRLRPIYLHAIWLCHTFSQWYIKTTLLSDQASFPRIPSSGATSDDFWRFFLIFPVFFTTNASFSKCITMIVPVSNLVWIPAAALLHRV